LFGAKGVTPSGAVAHELRWIRSGSKLIESLDIAQATLELVTRSRRTPFVSYQHILNSLEQKFLSRIEDRRRAIGGRSPIETAIARAVPVDSPDHGARELEDRGAAVRLRARRPPRGKRLETPFWRAAARTLVIKGAGSRFEWYRTP
jgi:hypothetical protein